MNWETHNYNTLITQHLQGQGQSDNEIWSVNRIKLEKYFSSKIMQKTRLGD